MITQKQIIAIPGSTRQHSSNLDLINAIAELYAGKINVTIFQGLAGMPHFNPYLDTDRPPKEVSDFRQQLRAADGILICTPKYAMGVPGSLKNALDWTVSSMEFSHKPVALITASSSGQKAHHSLIDTLKVIEAVIPDQSQLVISFVKTKIMAGKIIDAGTLELVQQVINSLIKSIDMKESM